MAAYNSAIHSIQDDTDMTMINHSFLYGQNDEPIRACLPILRRLQQANRPSAVSEHAPVQLPSSRRDDYVFIDQDPFQVGKQLEEILDFYRKELKLESNSQLDCNRQLITRLIDFIRPIYSSSETKIKDLDGLSQEICFLHDKRSVEQKEKHEQLQNKIRHLKKSIVSTPLQDDSRHSLMANLYRMNSVADYEQWMDMEDETKKLYSLVQRQREQIDTLIELLSTREPASTDERSSLSTSTTAPVDNSVKTCSLCDFEFPDAFTYEQIIQHFETCLVATNADAPQVPAETKQLPCPYCNRMLPDTDHLAYLEHVSKCCNNISDND